MIMKKPESVDEAKEWMKELADYLDKVPYASSRLVFGSNAIRGYLNGTQTSLDHAFGLIPSAGRKKRKSKHFDLALEVFEKRLNGKKWDIICDELTSADTKSIDDVSKLRNDPNELQRLLKRCHDEIMDEYSNKVWEKIMEDGL